MPKKLITWIGIALSIGLVVYITFTFDIIAALQALGLADPYWLGAAMLAYCLQFPLRGLRWAVLMRSVKPVSWATATEVFTIGFMANNVLPARLGDVARAFVLAKRESIPASATFSNVMLERVFDGLTVVGILSLVLWIDPPEVAWVGAVAGLTGLVFAAAVAVAALVSHQEARVLALVSRVLAPPSGHTCPGTPEHGPCRRCANAARVVALFTRLAKGLHTLKSPRDTLIVGLLSVTIWSAEVVVYVLAQRAFGLNLSPLALAVVMAILTLGLTAPSAPGFLGVYEGLIIQGLSVYGVGQPLAPAFAIAMHVIHFIPGTLLGLACAWRRGMKLGEIRSAREGLEETRPEPALRRRERSADHPKMEMS